MHWADLDFHPMTEADVPVLAPIMKRAFEYDAQLSERPNGGPEGYDNGAFLRKRLKLPDVEGYRIDFAGQPIGAVMLFVHPEDAAGHLSCIFIDKDRMGHGYGAAAWEFVEHIYPNINTWTLNTLAVSYRNHCFYINKLGFHVVAVEECEDKYSAMFRLKKDIRR